MGLNPFVQVFYSNKLKFGELLIMGFISLNPFVQVFYSNTTASIPFGGIR